jgi:hypothetical protein
MLTLESKGNVVLYAAPVFTTPDELCDAYTSDSVVSRSVFVRPSTIGPLPDDEAHHLSFQTPHKLYFCSRPREINPERVHSLLSEELPMRARHARARSWNQFYLEAAEELIEVYERRGEKAIAFDNRAASIRRLRQTREPAEYAGLVSRTLFDMDLLVVPRPEEDV